MRNPNDPQSLTLRDTAKGIAIRAGILTIGGVVISAWLFSLAAKAASGLVKVMAGALILAIGGGFAAWEVKKVQKRFGHHDTQPALQ